MPLPAIPYVGRETDSRLRREEAELVPNEADVVVAETVLDLAAVQAGFVGLRLVTTVWSVWLLELRPGAGSLLTKKKKKNHGSYLLK